MDTNINANTDAGITIANRYRFIKLAGRGGMGDVHLAHDLVLGRQVAVKSITSTFQDNPEIRRRIERECRLHAALSPHPGIIALHDRIEENGNVYLILEYFEGEPLSAYLERFHKNGRRLPLTAAVNIVCQVLNALGHIHAHNILHRDIKPGNVMVAKSPDGTYVAKLMDFGIAVPENQETQAAQVTMMASTTPGSPTYMAPERIDPDTFGQACPATDLYAVGIMLYEMLCSHPPFQGTLTEIFVAQLSNPVNFDTLPPEISSSVKKVLQKALHKKTADRYGSAAEMLSDLDAIWRKCSQMALESSLEPENINTAATLLASDAQSSSVIQKAVQKAIAQTRKRSRQKRRFSMGCAALCLAVGISVLVLVAIFVPVPAKCTRECSNFWENGKKCRWFLSWHNLMWDRKQKCKSDNWWNYTSLCYDDEKWLKQKQKCESDDWWKYKKDCKTYPVWQERKQKCESYDWQHKKLCRNYGEWPDRIRKCESGEFWNEEKLCYENPEWRRLMWKKWCVDNRNFWKERQSCEKYQEWREKMKLWCQQNNSGENRQYCEDYRCQSPDCGQDNKPNPPSVTPSQPPPLKTFLRSWMPKNPENNINRKTNPNQNQSRIYEQNHKNKKAQSKIQGQNENKIKINRKTNLNQNQSRIYEQKP